MKKLTTLLMTLMLMSSALWAEETVTVSANSSDISEGLDLKVVAKLFAEARNLEEFETMLNNPDSAFCNLDLNGDGQVDYLRVVEIGEGNKRLIVLQAVLAKDIFQDVASIYVEKDEKNEVSVQVIGDEYVYGKNYIIEPVYVYRPVIYDWFWSSVWHAWVSPWFWGYWPSWWRWHPVYAYDWYWHRCYAWHHHHHWCSFRPGHSIHHGYHDLYHGARRNDYATRYPEHSFAHRNAGMTNAREIRNTNSVRPTRSAGGTRGPITGTDRSVAANSRTFGSTHTAVARRGGEGRSVNASAQHTRGGNATATRSANDNATRSTSATATRSTSNSSATRSSNSATRSTSNSSATRSTNTTRSTSNSSATRSTNTTSRSTATRSTSTSAPTRSSSSSSYSGSSRSGSTYSGGSRGSGSYGGGHSSGGSRGGGSYGGGHSGGGSRGGGGGGHRR
ncbi:MAG: hypothetical protein J6T80_04010 [Paludibacteraceae bacterium]|nr:hypothetical protein [Paludibacteraceae bacterium]